MQLKAYIDGGCDPNPGVGCWAFVIVDENEEVLHTGFGTDLETTNNRMEYEALINVLKHLEPTDRCTIYSDSQLLVNTWNDWMEKWEKKNWKTSSGPVKNQDLVRELFELKKTYSQMKLKWIKGHNGHKWNETVDEICTLEIKKLKEL